MHKMKYLIISILFLTAGTSFGLTATWTNGSGDRLWSNQDNWDGGLPTGTWGDPVYIGIWPYNVTGPVINSGVANGWWMALGMDYSSSLDVTGGSLNGFSLSVGHCATAGAGSVMTMSGGQVNLSYAFVVGGTTDKTTVSGILNMSGGVITSEGYFNIGNGDGGAGTVNLSGGTINSPDIWMRDSTDAHPKLDITSSGKVVLPIGMKSRVELYNGNGWITGYGSSEDVVITEIEGGTKIEVTAIPEPMTIGLLAIGSLLALRKRS